MVDPKNLEQLRLLGKLEQVSAVCHHLGFYQNVGLSAHYTLSGSSSVTISRHLIFAALSKVIRKHSILSAIPIDEDTLAPYFARLPLIDLEQFVFIIDRSKPFTALDGTEDRELDEILQTQHNTNFKFEYGSLPFWRLLILQHTELKNEFTASFIFHHGIGDGVSGLVFHRAFRNALEEASPLIPEGEKVVLSSTDPLVPPLEELHPMPINTNATPPPTPALKEWTGKPIHAPCVSHYRTLYISPTATTAFIQECKKQKVSVTSALGSSIATILFDILPPSFEALTCIIPVSLRPWLRLPRNVADDAIGTYIDAFKAQFTRPADGTADIWPGARAASKVISNYLTSNLSPSGEPYTAVAIFKTIPDVSIIFNSTLGKDRDAAFEVSNLGSFLSGSAEEGTDSLWKVGRVTFSRSSVVSGSAVTMSVVSGGDGGLSIGFSWQEGVVEDVLVDKLFDGMRTSVLAFQ
ncbi:hypothetical protein P154DRAFT_521774 [Amniculicola lignicola CBS 123094]|uniref:Alcohol acetyltransferase n=1 Tax=Amniculicola lignicola CBS 123094 TaxID=1392246 RepID=A0A6A5WIX0_9PLEO|nr:hypothetical protein P154DRAFT_521774 [Amniculicola lignicola CBS 123094]